MPLILKPNFSDTASATPPLREYEPGDAFYEALIEMHQGLSDEQSAEVDARLVLLLANHIGDLSVLREAFAIARAGVANRGE